jgi:dihydropteroate synthase
MIGAMTGRKIATDRLAGSIAAAVIAVQRGARMVRVHDVAATLDALAVWQAVQAGDTPTRRDDKPSAPRWPDDE